MYKITKLNEVMKVVNEVTMKQVDPETLLSRCKKKRCSL